MADRLNRETGGRLRSRVAVIPNFIELERIARLRRDRPEPRLSNGTASNRIIWCGSFIERKRPHLAIDVLEHLLSSSGADWHLVMVGDGPLYDSVFRRVQESDIRSFVTLLGYQSNPIAAMAQCNVGLITSSLEGYPNVMLEMLASGVNGVVITRCAGCLSGTPGVLVSDSHAPSDVSHLVRKARATQQRAAVAAFLDARDVASYLEKITGSSPLAESEP